VCSAGSRLIAQENIAEGLVAKIKERLKHFRLGDSLDKVKNQGFSAFLYLFLPTHHQSIG
jgi:aldehyde dehydrogenase (NAD+)